MTYKQIVDNFEQIANDHQMIADFGYGQLTDIKNQGDDSEADCPYMFLNPTTHTRTERTIVYRFNLIMMEMANSETALQTQSDCQQYIDDVLAELKYDATRETDITINVTLTPFKERFQDVVAGMTATIEIEVPSALNNCITPY